MSSASATNWRVHPTGRWQRSPGDPGLDAALLMPAIRGAVAADDPRTAETLRAYLAELTQDGYAYRFRHDERPLGEAEGAFLLCGFIVTLALHQQGQEVEAARWFERNRAACGSPGLYAEEYRSSSPSASSGGTCRRRSCTRWPSSAPPGLRRPGTACDQARNNEAPGMKVQLLSDPGGKKDYAVIFSTGDDAYAGMINFARSTT